MFLSLQTLPKQYRYLLDNIHDFLKIKAVYFLEPVTRHLLSEIVYLNLLAHEIGIILGVGGAHPFGTRPKLFNPSFPR